MELAAHGIAGRVIALAKDAVAAAVLSEGLPDHDKATVVQPRNSRESLGVACRGVNLELPADGIASPVITLTKDSVAAAVLTQRLPDNDEAAIIQRRDGRLVLVAACVRIHLELGP